MSARDRINEYERQLDRRDAFLQNLIAAATIVAMIAAGPVLAALGWLKD